MLHRITLTIQGVRLHYDTPEPDMIVCLNHARDKCTEIVKALKASGTIKDLEPGQIEIRIDPIDPQLSLFPELLTPLPHGFTVGGGRKTLRDLN